MSIFPQWISKHWGSSDNSSDAEDAGAVELILAEVVNSIDPLISQSPGYPKKYIPALRQALSYIDELLQQVPGPIKLDRENFSKSHLVHALFASTNELERELQTSIAMREYRSSGEAEIFALMGVRWKWQVHFGVERSGDKIRSDVAQNTIDFKDHTFTLPTATADECWQQLRNNFVKRLANSIAENIRELKTERDDLKHSAKQLESKLRKTSKDQTLKLEQSQQREKIEQLWGRWRELNTELDTNHTLQHFNSVMNSPNNYLRLEQESVSIDKMGIERNTKDGGESIDLVNLYSADRRIWTFMLVEFKWQPPLSTAEQIAEDSRWLEIS
ncbi:MAG: hypothetical protein HOM84_07350 [Thiotrichales bacterium]|jgi:hypothetical protein|nr:hypothetical protein [Thiotrichales bacterium]MBT3613781.1 hypothetical protein [Thiotrichales bacterium]MBT3753221.1 hypothetical protein [Thiotrichales bacterium]MBT3837874.1 hypothetical protein [Thiotrichales bacterium]MBT4152073.1 hypothetical protein [Thiotrichales bacterium]